MDNPRNVTASMRKSSVCVREGMSVVGGMLSLRPIGCSKAQGKKNMREVADKK